MRVNKDLCVGCLQCAVYCPMQAIHEVDGQAVIDEDECVECGVCRRVGVCPVDALEQPPLEWPRVLRSLFSDPITVHPQTGVAGRGTDELKNNDVTGRFREGYIGFGIELGRPNVGTRFSDIEYLSVPLAKLGVMFEPKNPVTFLMEDVATGKIREDVKNEKALTSIIEFVVPEEKAAEVMSVIEESSRELPTVMSVEVISKVTGDETPPGLAKLRELGYSLSSNGKVCLGIGRSGNEAGREAQ